MLRIDPVDIMNKKLKVGTIGLPKKYDYYNTKEFKKIENEASKYVDGSNGKRYIVWNFDNLEANMFRSMRFQSYVMEQGHNRILPRYINQISSFDFKLNTIGIMFILKSTISC